MGVNGAREGITYIRAVNAVGQAGALQDVEGPRDLLEVEVSLVNGVEDLARVLLLDEADVADPVPFANRSCKARRQSLNRMLGGESSRSSLTSTGVNYQGIPVGSAHGQGHPRSVDLGSLGVGVGRGRCEVASLCDAVRVGEVNHFRVRDEVAPAGGSPGNAEEKLDGCVVHTRGSPQIDVDELLVVWCDEQMLMNKISDVSHEMVDTGQARSDCLVGTHDGRNGGR